MQTTHSRTINAKKLANIDILQNVVFTTDLGRHKTRIKQIFPDLALAPTQSTHINAQPEGRIFKTIVKIQSNDSKCRIFPGNIGHRIDHDYKPQTRIPQLSTPNAMRMTP